jgi:hypothetical protein
VKLTVAQRIKKFSAFYEAHRFITIFPRSATGPYLVPEENCSKLTGVNRELHRNISEEHWDTMKGILFQSPECRQTVTRAVHRLSSRLSKQGRWNKHRIWKAWKTRENPKETFEICKRNWDDIAKEMEWESVKYFYSAQKNASLMRSCVHMVINIWVF